MSIDEQHVAMPQLYGAPAYARPPKVVEAVRPFDPDELPIEADQTEEDRRLAADPPAPSAAGHATSRSAAAGRGSRPQLRPRALSVRALAERLVGGS